MSCLLKCSYTTIIRQVCCSSFILSSSPTIFRLKFKRHYNCPQMGFSSISSDYCGKASLRLCNVSGHMTDLLEIRSPNPTLHVLYIPGNPGIVNFYKDFVESLYELLEGRASVTAIGHISQTTKDWEHGRLFSLEEQIIHKIDFIGQELQNSNIPLILVGHSVGSYISVEVFKRASQKVNYFVGLYPFLTLNTESSKQTAIKKLVESPIVCLFFSFFVALMGLIPSFSRFIVKNTIGSSWSQTAIDAGCSHLLKKETCLLANKKDFVHQLNEPSVGHSCLTCLLNEFGFCSRICLLNLMNKLGSCSRAIPGNLCSLTPYHTIRNVLFMAMTEFQEFSEAPDWKFLRAKQDQIAFLFGEDDHWGPLSLFEEISKQAPKVALMIENEGHDHAYSCTIAGSRWVAEHVAGLIQKRSSTL